MKYLYSIIDGRLAQRYESAEEVPEGLPTFAADEIWLTGRQVVDGKLVEVVIQEPQDTSSFLPPWMQPQTPQPLLTLQPEEEVRVTFVGTELFNKAYIKAHKSLPLSVQLGIAIAHERQNDQESLKRSIKTIESILRKLKATQAITKASHTVPAKDTL